MCAHHGIGDGADQLGLAFFVDGQNEGAIGGDVDCLVVEAAVQGKGLDLVARGDTRALLTIQNSLCVLTYCFRSYIVIRLPTGLMTEFPSGVNDRFPLRYTVPKRFSNCRREIRS